jgi:ATP-dependent exoDNAse (exonuclease V) beta subunit
VSSAVADHDQRLRALDPCQSFCVSAPAGSGKTELLIQRYLTLLARVEHPEEVLAITFTRKAAAEMRARVVASLSDAASRPCPQDDHSVQTWTLAKAVLATDARQDWHLLRNPARLNIKTIDSFCAGLTRQMPVLSGFGGAVSPVDDSMPAYRDATRGLLDLLGTKHPAATDLARILLHFDDNWARLEELLIGMLRCRDQWLVLMGTGLASETAQQVLQHSVIGLVEDDLAEFAEVLGTHHGELMELYAYSQAQLDRDELAHWPAASAADLPAWQSILTILLTAKDEWRKTVNKNTGFPTGSAQARDRKQQHLALLESMRATPGLLEQLQVVRHLPSMAADDEHWQLVLAVSRLLPVLAAQLTLVFAQRGEVDHTQIAMSALEALGDDEHITDLALKLDYRLSHILVDEFQDTAVTQYELIRRLTRGWDQHNHQNTLAPRTIYIVGDPMQSIYGFRDADVGLFMLAKERGFNGVLLEPLTLTCNFRSDGQLVEWVNGSFAHAFPATENIRHGEIIFSASQVQRERDQVDPITLAVFTDTGEALSAADQEAQWLATQIEQGLDDPACESIAVLVRSRAHLRPLVAELKRRQLSWQAQDIDLLAKSPVVRDLQALCRALHNWSDSVAWFALLRAPWCGLELSDLLSVSQRVGQGTVWQCLQAPATLEALSEAGQVRLQKLCVVLEQAMIWQQRLGLRDWIESTWLALRGPACAVHDTGLADAREFLDLLEALDNRGEPFDVAAVAEQVDALYASPASADTKLQLMTLHKAKGLEFDWVFIPGLAKVPRSEQRELLLWEDYHRSSDGGLGFLFAVDDKEDAGAATLYNYLHRVKKRKRERESTRLLYVGVTRAVKRLFLSACLDRDGETGDWKEPRQQSLLYSIRAVFEREKYAPIASLTAALATAEVADKDLLRLAVETVPAVIGPAVSPQPGADANIPEVSHDKLARQLGTVIHASLHRLSAFDEAALQAVDCRKYRDWWRQQLRRLHIATADLEPAVAAVEMAVASVLADPRGRRILSSEREQAYSEYELSSLRADGRLAEHIIDRTYVENNIRWVVDYKSAVPDSGQALAQFLEQQSQRYAPQMQRYRELFLAMEKRPVKTALYFTTIPYWLELR